jgi:hypothetical protein
MFPGFNESIIPFSYGKQHHLSEPNSFLQIENQSNFRAAEIACMLSVTTQYLAAS